MSTNMNTETQKIRIRRAADSDISAISKLLYQVHKVHSDLRPDLFRPGSRKYNNDELKTILADDRKPVFVAEREGDILGYAFCIHQEHTGHPSLTDIKTLYIDDLCVDEEARHTHIGSLLYEYVLDYAAQNNFYNVTLNVWAGNDKARKFYEKMGLGVQKTGMEKILDTPQKNLPDAADHEL